MPIRTKFNQRYRAAMMPPILSSEQRDLIYGALQKSGGTMIGDLSAPNLTVSAGKLYLPRTSTGAIYISGVGEYQNLFGFHPSLAILYLYPYTYGGSRGLEIDGSNRRFLIHGMDALIDNGRTIDGVDVSEIPTTYLPLAGGTMSGDLTIQKNNALLKLIDDSGNISLIKGTTSQLCLDADPDDNDAGDTTDIIFKLDGSEVGRFLKGGNFGLGTVLPRKELEVRGSIIAREGFGTELWDVAGGHFETAVQNVEYYSPNPHGGIYGQIYRQYFPAVLTGTNPRLDTAGIVAKLVDFVLHFHENSDYFVTHGFFRGFATGEANIVFNSNNLSIAISGQTLDDGWIDYTKT